MFFKRFIRVSMAATLCGGALTFSAPDALAQGQTMVITKHAGDTNPKICLVSFQGPEEVKQKLLNTLQMCDWFTVTNDPQSQYTLGASYSGGGLAMQLGGDKTDSFTQPAAGSRTGPCTAP